MLHIARKKNSDKKQASKYSKFANCVVASACFYNDGNSIIRIILGIVFSCSGWFFLKIRCFAWWCFVSASCILFYCFAFLTNFLFCKLDSTKIESIPVSPSPFNTPQHFYFCIRKFSFVVFILIHFVSFDIRKKRKQAVNSKEKKVLSNSCWCRHHSTPLIEHQLQSSNTKSVKIT